MTSSLGVSAACRVKTIDLVDAMTETKNPFRTAGYFFYLSAALHVVAIVLSGGALFGTLAGAVVLWGLIGYFLITRPRRWLAHLGFIGALVGIVASVSVGTQYSGLTGMTMTAITLADIGAAVLLFGALWRSPVKA
ncbi:hypothetical protein TA5114_02123 [Cognatishimia activa]|uniref:Uncharacterized protein n=2 Tax=Cognatishimia activa TaxID=1715691 RepID=A0A0P1IRU8_9RHOB|nr:hypothetical protein TA5113_00951 [Cognatishimia activa]CUK26314.1 hypothetical protein TA5114_02123 [Cognatishimia activa]